MFSKILIANRGEIACRIQRTCRRMGIATVAVYSEADAHSRHVAEADFALPIGPAPAVESYLRAEHIVAAALASGAQAIHPGYGFLSEKLALIDACQAHGLTFIGPHRAAIASMGSKIESKRLARAAGVLCVPGYDGGEEGGGDDGAGIDQDPQHLLTQALRIGFPLLIKASAGGGGKGMRRVDSAADFLPLLTLARKEAQAAFGDARVLIEKYIVNPRHLEVQLVGDRHGGLVHLFERECSVQRRFQKVIEEAPAHHLHPATAAKLYQAALRMGRAMGYDNAGTVEFVLDADASDHGGEDAEPYFLEVNTRLQVEHPVTELTTGIDLVEWQLRVAAGEPLPRTQAAITRSGWAIECRLNAEEPDCGYRASFGPLLGYSEPTRLAGVRVDSGLHATSEVTPYYDAMLAKVIGHGSTRHAAIANATMGLTQLRIEGLRTNSSLLLGILQHPAFDSVLTTRFLEQHFADVLHQPQALHAFAVAAAWAEQQATQLLSTASVWSALRGFRLPPDVVASIELQCASSAAGGPLPVLPNPLRLTCADGGYGLPEQPAWRAVVVMDASAATSTVSAWQVHITDAGTLLATVHVKRAGQRWWTWAQGQSEVWALGHALTTRASAAADGAGAGSSKRLYATLPGRIAEVQVQPGDSITAGDTVLTLEAMKLYHALSAPLTGQVLAIHVKVGDIVAQGQLLLECAAAEAVASAVLEQGN
jgi:3-methylcrotonyl-CoA carboxylase alpha subunit